MGMVSCGWVDRASVLDSCAPLPSTRMVSRWLLKTTAMRPSAIIGAPNRIDGPMIEVRSARHRR